MAPKKAIIVESPTKTRTLSGFLGEDYKLLASMGHVRDLPDGDMGVDLEGDFSPTYVVSGSKAIKTLKKELKGIEEVYLATDPDREGEAIAWHILDELGLHNAHRIQFNEITREAVQEALQHPGDLNMDRVDAQQARRILDRLVGYSLSPVLWKKVGGGRPDSGLSAGRVQSVALRLITDRERERAAFDPEEWWSITALLQPESGEQFEADLKHIDGEDIERTLESEEQVTPLVDELSDRQPGMMTLIALAISVAFFYSAAVVLGVEGTTFFWELVTLIDVMLLGHWIEMRSVRRASSALDELAKLMPDTAE
ncbi:MAG: DNA topoisomerase, partial [Armatimonadota bacterium]